jgi:hypothetical protein
VALVRNYIHHPHGMGSWVTDAWNALVGKPQSWYTNLSNIQSQLSVVLAGVTAVGSDLWNTVSSAAGSGASGIFDYGSIVPWVRNLEGTLVGIAGPDAVSLHTLVELEGRDLRTYASFDISAGERVPFVLTWFPSNEPVPEPVVAAEPAAVAAEIASWGEVPISSH